MIPGRRASAAIAGGGFGYALGDQICSAVTHAPGSWLTWQAITFIAGLLVFVAGLALFAYRVAVPLPQRSRSRLQPDYSWIARMEREVWGRRSSTPVRQRTTARPCATSCGPSA